MFKKILFATSATEACDHAARVAFNLAETLNAHIRIFHVPGVPSRGYSQMMTDVKTKEKVDVHDEYLAWVEEEIKTYYAGQLNAGIDASIKVVVGIPHREILRETRDMKPDILIMGGSTGPDEQSVYKTDAGSTLKRVARAAHCPVMMIARPAASFWGGMSSIVFGTDFSKASDRAFDFALNAAAALNCELHIFHALDITASQGGNAPSQDDIEARIREAYRLVRSRYASKIKADTAFSMAVWEGVPYVEIVKYAREKHADLIVMAHNSRKLDGETPKIGSNMEQVIVRAGCPVISVNR